MFFVVVILVNVFGGNVHKFNMLTYLKQIFTLVKMVQPYPHTDERIRRNEEKPEVLALRHIRVDITSFHGSPDFISWQSLLHFRAAFITVIIFA